MAEILAWFAEYWEALIATLLVAIASLDKVALVLMKTVDNIRDTWRELKNN